MTALTQVRPTQARKTSRSHLRSWPEFIVVTMLGLPFIAAIVRTLRGVSRLPGDFAATELAVRAVGSHAVLLGPYSRFGWRHPGPIYFYVLAPFYWLLGADVRAITLGAIGVNLTAVGLILVFARRRGGRGLMLWTAFVLALVIWHLDEAVWSSWGPYVTILSAAAFLIAAWSLACLDRWALPIVLVGGSFLVQTHVAYLPMVVGVGVVAFTIFTARVVRGTPNLGGWRVPSAVGLGLLICVWIPPTMDVVLHHPNNVGRLLAFRDDPRGFENESWGRPRSSGVASSTSTHTLFEGWQVATQGLSGFLDGRADQLDSDSSAHQEADAQGGSWASLATVGAVVGAGALAIRRRRWDTIVLFGLLVVAFAVSVYAVSDVVGPLFTFLVAWTSVLSLAAWVVVGAAISPELERGWVKSPVAVVAATLAGLAVVLLLWPGPAPIAPAGTGLDDARPFEPMVSHVERRVPHGRRVVVRISDLNQWFVAAGLVAGLRADGYNAFAERDPGAMTVGFEPRDLRDARPGDTIVTVAAGPSTCPDRGVCLPTSEWMRTSRAAS